MWIKFLAFAAGPRPYAENLVKYYRYMREQDIYAAYAVLPPQAARYPAFYQKQNLPIPSLQRGRPEFVVATTLRGECQERIRQPIGMALRRERQHGHVRECQGALGTRLRYGRRSAVA